MSFSPYIQLMPRPPLHVQQGCILVNTAYKTAVAVCAGIGSGAIKLDTAQATIKGCFPIPTKASTQHTKDTSKCDNTIFVPKDLTDVYFHNGRPYDKQNRKMQNAGSSDNPCLHQSPVNPAVGRVLLNPYSTLTQVQLNPTIPELQLKA